MLKFVPIWHGPAFSVKERSQLSSHFLITFIGKK